MGNKCLFMVEQKGSKLYVFNPSDDNDQQTIHLKKKLKEEDDKFKYNLTPRTKGILVKKKFLFPKNILPLPQYIIETKIIFTNKNKGKKRSKKKGM